MAQSIYTDADAALKLLGKNATWMERNVLGSVKYLYDVTITHHDLEYMQKVLFSQSLTAHCPTHSSMQYYETEYKTDLAAESKTKEDEDTLEFASKNFRPLYYTMQYPQDKNKIEMSFGMYKLFNPNVTSGLMDPTRSNSLSTTIPRRATFRTRLQRRHIFSAYAGTSPLRPYISNYIPRP